MKTILIFVSSLDGKVTKWDNPEVRSWSSKNDQEYFDKIWNDTKVVIMGRGTFKQDPVMPNARHLFIVMTKEPDKYKRNGKEGQLEFTDESPSSLVNRFENEGYIKILVVGGPQIATAFLREQLIDELWLTIEPKIFGIGASFVVEEKLDIDLNLLSCENVNDKGTLITKYSVIKRSSVK